jgi:UDP-N-acetylmuramoylalanine--D-glutamate ligase
MLTKAELFFNKIKDKKVVFIGLGVSHTNLVKLLCKKGISVSVCDRASKEDLGEIYQELLKLGVNFCLGEKYLDNILQADIIFRTPGMNYYSPILLECRKKGIVVTSEMEVFFDLCPCKTYAVTGSDGKTTSTTLIAELLKAQGKKVHLGGNIGKALLPIIEEISQDDVAVVELSSFQLTSMRCSPDVSVITNITPNHLDVHKDMDEYIEAKCNLILHQGAFSRTVLNLDNETTSGLSGLVRGELLWFSRTTVPQNGVYLAENGDIFSVKNSVQTRIMSKDDIKLPGIHNVENYLTAISATLGEIDVENIVNVAKEFGGVEHRIEFVTEINNVKYYNDSIATSPTRTIAGLNSFNQKLIVISGGYDKKIPYEPLAPHILNKVKVLILLGATAKKIEKAILENESFENSEIEIIHAQTLENAVDIASKRSTSGDIIILSPASASFDMYKNFEQRGNHFKNIVNSRIKEK